MNCNLEWQFEQATKARARYSEGKSFPSNVPFFRSYNSTQHFGSVVPPQMNILPSLCNGIATGSDRPDFIWVGERVQQPTGGGSAGHKPFDGYRSVYTYAIYKDSLLFEYVTSGHEQATIDKKIYRSLRNFFIFRRWFYYRHLRIKTSSILQISPANSMNYCFLYSNWNIYININVELFSSHRSPCSDVAQDELMHICCKFQLNLVNLIPRKLVISRGTSYMWKETFYFELVLH